MSFSMWLVLIGILLIFYPRVKGFLVAKWPRNFSGVKSPLMFWTLVSVVDLVVCGGLIFGSTVLGLWLAPVIIGTILGLVVLMGCLVNWILG